MNAQIKSIFNLIEIFRRSKKIEDKTINAKAYCAKSHHHDFYCDAERPFISI
jgi:hypothetical protein